MPLEAAQPLSLLGSRLFLLSWERVYLNGHSSVELFSVSADALHFGPVGVGVEAVEHAARTFWGVTENLPWVEHRLLLAHDLLLAEALHYTFPGGDDGLHRRRRLQQALEFIN